MSKRNGFTLIELMIVLIIVGILTAIAVPTYMRHVQSARRTDGKATLLDAYARMERYYSENNTYATATINSGNQTTDILSSQSTACTNGSMPSTEEFYCISFQAGPTATSFTLQAIPIAGTAQADDLCGTLTINSLSQKGQAAGATITCW